MSEAAQPAAQASTEAAQGASAPANSQAPAKTSEAATPAKAPEAQKAPGAKPAATETLITEGEKESEGAKPGSETKPAKEEKPVVPEKYDLKLPKDSPLSNEYVEKFSAFAKEKGLSSEEAQARLERESQAVSDYQSRLKSTQDQMVSGWVEQGRADKEIGGEAFKENVELAKRVVTRFGTDEFRKELNKTGLGNHPELVRVFSRIGKAMSDDQLVHASAPAGTKGKSAAEILYGGSGKKEN